MRTYGSTKVLQKWWTFVDEWRTQFPFVVFVFIFVVQETAAELIKQDDRYIIEYKNGTGLNKAVETA